MTIRLRRIRRRRGLSQEKLGDLANQSKMQVSRHEKQHRSIKVEKMVDYAVALACHPAELLDAPWTIRREEIGIIETYRSLEPSQKQLLLRMLRGLEVAGGPEIVEEPPEDEEELAASG